MANKKKNLFVRMFDYCKECSDELRYKVSWPTFQELSNSTVVVLIASLIIAVFVFLVDQGFERIVSSIYSLIA